MDEAGIRIKCIFNPNTGEFGGMADWPQAGYHGPVTGRLSTLFFEKKKPPVKRGRPKAIKKDVAALMYVSMAKELIGLGKNKARLKAAEILAIGDQNKPDDVIRAMIRHENKADDLFRQSEMGGDAILWFGDDARPDAPGPSLIIMDKSDRPRIRRDSAGRWQLVGDGHGWFCDWDDKKAKYGRIKFSASFDTRPNTTGLEELLEVS